MSENHSGGGVRGGLKVFLNWAVFMLGLFGVGFTIFSTVSPQSAHNTINNIPTHAFLFLGLHQIHLAVFLSIMLVLKI